MSAGPSTAARRGMVEEDAGTLTLGPEFKKATCMSNAEVALILERKREIMQSKGMQPKSDFLKAYQYVNSVKQFRDDHIVRQVRGELAKKTWLEQFESTQLINLCPQDPQEAKALIPSLVMENRDIDNAQLNEVLEQITSCKQYTSA